MDRDLSTSSRRALPTFQLIAQSKRTNFRDVRKSLYTDTSMPSGSAISPLQVKDKPLVVVAASSSPQGSVGQGEHVLTTSIEPNLLM